MKRLILILIIFISGIAQTERLNSDTTQTISSCLISIGKKSHISILFESNDAFSKQIKIPNSEATLEEVLNEINRIQPIKWMWKNKSTLVIEIDKMISFKILSTENNMAVSGVTIIDEKHTQKVVSDEKGIFTIDRSYLNKRFDLTHVNYKSRSIILTKTNPTIYLTDRTYYADPIQIYSIKQPVTQSYKSSFSLDINKEAMDDLKVVGDFNEKISFFSGIASIQQKSSGLSIQASPDAQHQMFFDRMTIYQQNHLFGFVSAINDEIIDKVNLYKGSYPARFGGRLSGIIDIESKAADFNTNETIFNVDFLKTDLQTQFTINDKVNVLFSYRRSLIDLYDSNYSKEVLSFIQRKQYVTFNNKLIPNKLSAKQPKALFYDVNSKISYTPTPTDYFSLSYFRSVDEHETFHFADYEFRPNDIVNKKLFKEQDKESKQWENDGFSLLWLKEWSDSWSSNMYFSLSNFSNYKSNSLERINEIGLDTNLNRFSNGNKIVENSFKISSNYKLDSDKNMEFGYHLNQINNKVENNYVDSLSYNFIKKSKEYSHAFFLQQELVFDSLVLNTGLRLVSYSASDKLFIEPRLSLAYNLSPIRVTLNYSEQDQFLKHIYTHNFERANRETFWILANDNLPVEHAKNTSITFSRSGEHSETELEFFYNQVSGQTYAVDLYNRKIEWNTSNSTGLRSGLTFSHIQRIQDLTINMTYQYSKSTYELDKIEKDHFFYAENDHRHQLFTNISYQLGNYQFQASNVFKTGAPYTKLTEDDPTKFFQNIMQINNARLENYNQFNISAQYTHASENVEYSYGLRIQNLFNNKNIWTSYYEREPRSKELIRKDIEMIGTLPSLFFKVKF